MSTIPVPMKANPDVSGGLVSESTMPVGEATRLVTELRAAGVEADWAPDADFRAAAWLYVTEDDVGGSWRDHMEEQNERIARRGE